MAPGMGTLAAFPAAPSEAPPDPDEVLPVVDELPPEADGCSLELSIAELQPETSAAIAATEAHFPTQPTQAIRTSRRRDEQIVCQPQVRGSLCMQPRNRWAKCATL